MYIHIYIEREMYRLHTHTYTCIHTYKHTQIHKGMSDSLKVLQMASNENELNIDSCKCIPV